MAWSLHEATGTAALKPFTVNIELEQGGLPFHLQRRKLRMGRAGEIDYFWMDSRSFRSGAGGLNLRSCIELSQAFVRRDFPDDPDKQVDLVLAELFPLINRSKAAQDSFLDAYLHPSARREIELPKREVSAIHRLIEARDPARVRAKFEKLFGGERPPPNRQPAFDEAFRRWMVNATIQHRQGGPEAVRAFVCGEMKHWIGVYRKRGNDPQPRMFINMVFRAAKAAFYGCYHMAWVSILTMLPQSCDLNPASVRFLRQWHLVAQDITQDIFWGVPLALHPLSEFVMKREEHRVAIGEWLARPPSADTSEDADWEDPAYRGMLKAVFIAASEYKDVWEREKDRRARPAVHKNPKSRGKTTTAKVKSQAGRRRASPDEATAGQLFNAYAHTKAMVWPRCGEGIEYESHCSTNDKHVLGVKVTYRCIQCGNTFDEIVESDSDRSGQCDGEG